MLSLTDKRWSDLKGGYRATFDPRPLLAKLENEVDTEATWKELWEELHHQGDVGDASYAAVPHLVRIYRQHPTVDWNTYAIVAVIELARDEKRNPKIPAWLEKGYFAAIQELADVARSEIGQAKDFDVVRAMLSILALSKGMRTHARFLVNYSEDELLDFEKQVFEGGT